MKIASVAHNHICIPAPSQVGPDGLSRQPAVPEKPGGGQGPQRDSCCCCPAAQVPVLLPEETCRKVLGSQGLTTRFCLMFSDQAAILHIIQELSFAPPE
jgi:hypothetical protein